MSTKKKGKIMFIRWLTFFLLSNRRAYRYNNICYALVCVCVGEKNNFPGQYLPHANETAAHLCIEGKKKLSSKQSLWTVSEKKRIIFHPIVPWRKLVQLLWEVKIFFPRVLTEKKSTFGILTIFVSLIIYNHPSA